MPPKIFTFWRRRKPIPKPDEPEQEPPPQPLIPPPQDPPQDPSQGPSQETVINQNPPRRSILDNFFAAYEQSKLGNYHHYNYDHRHTSESRFGHQAATKDVVTKIPTKMQTKMQACSSPIDVPLKSVATVMMSGAILDPLLENGEMLPGGVFGRATGEGSSSISAAEVVGSVGDVEPVLETSSRVASCRAPTDVPSKSDATVMVSIGDVDPVLETVEMLSRVPSRRQPIDVSSKSAATVKVCTKTADRVLETMEPLSRVASRWQPMEVSSKSTATVMVSHGIADPVLETMETSSRVASRRAPMEVPSKSDATVVVSVGAADPVLETLEPLTRVASRRAPMEVSKSVATVAFSMETADRVLDPLNRVPSHRCPMDSSSKAAAKVTVSMETAAADESATRSADESSPSMLDRVLERMRRRFCPYRPLVSSNLTLPPENSADLSSSPEKAVQSPAETYIKALTRRLGQLHPHALYSTLPIIKMKGQSNTEFLREWLSSQAGRERSAPKCSTSGSVPESSGLRNDDDLSRRAPLAILGRQESDETSRQKCIVLPSSASSAGTLGRDGSPSPCNRPVLDFQSRRQGLTEPHNAHQHVSDIGKAKSAKKMPSTLSESQERAMVSDTLYTKIEIIRQGMLKRQQEEDRIRQMEMEDQQPAPAIQDPEDLYDYTPPTFRRHPMNSVMNGVEVIDLTSDDEEEGPTTEHYEYSYDCRRKPIDWANVDLYGVSPEGARPIVRAQPRPESPLERRAPPAFNPPVVDGPSSANLSTDLEMIDALNRTTSRPIAKAATGDVRREASKSSIEKKIQRHVHKHATRRGRRLLNATDNINSEEEAGYSMIRRNSSSDESMSYEDCSEGPFHPVEPMVLDGALPKPGDGNYMAPSETSNPAYGRY